MPVHKCPYCGLYFKALPVHIGLKHKRNPKKKEEAKIGNDMFYCEKCGRYFKTGKGLRIHMGLTHNPPKKKEKKGVPVPPPEYIPIRKIKKPVFLKPKPVGKKEKIGEEVTPRCKRLIYETNYYRLCFVEKESLAIDIVPVIEDIYRQKFLVPGVSVKLTERRYEREFRTFKVPRFPAHRIPESVTIRGVDAIIEHLKTSFPDYQTHPRRKHIREVIKLLTPYKNLSLEQLVRELAKKMRR